MPKYTLLRMVQKILSDMDAEDVNSIGDTTESTQVASIIEDTYYNIISNRDIPEHKEMLKLTALSDTDFPTHFEYPDSVNSIETVWYDTSDDNTFEYSEVYWCEPEDFLKRTDTIQSDYTTISDKNGGTKLRIVNNKHPEFYTSFDDKYLVFNAHKSSVDTTLQTSKSRALGVKYPTFTISDSFVPDLDANYFPYLLNESKSVAMSVLIGGSDPKIEQAARRQKSFVMKHKYNTKRNRGISIYGR